jgi:hypothetical protein
VRLENNAKHDALGKRQFHPPQPRFSPSGVGIAGFGPFISVILSLVTMAKTPSKKTAKAAKAAGDKKKRRHRRVESYSSYIYKVRGRGTGPVRPRGGGKR